MKKVLLCVKDTESERITELLKDSFEVKTVSAVKELSPLLSAFHPDAVFLSGSLYGYGVNELTKQIKSKGNYPVLIERDIEKNKIEEFLSSGCDDFISFPLRPKELLERLTILCENQSVTSEVFTCGKLTVDYDNCRVTVSGKMLHLTLLEYKLICLLSKNCGKVITYERIVEELWPSHIGNEITSLRVFASTLRKKLSVASGGENYIQTHMGLGYCMVSGIENI